jgi:hypothetical protein
MLRLRALRRAVSDGAAATARRALASHSAVSLADSVASLQAHGAADESVATAAFTRIVALDTDDAASTFLAQHRTPLLAVARSQTAAVGEPACRCIANISMVPDPAATNEDNESAPAGVKTFATALHEQEKAVQLVLAVMERGERLSKKGRAWSALALMNLCMFDDGAAREAAAAGAPSIAAAVLRLAVDDLKATSAADVEAADLVATESALAVIPRLLSLQTPTDQVEAAHYYQTVPVAVVEAVVHALGARLGVSMDHKAWEALRLIAAEPDNHAMLFRALHAEDGASGTKVLKEWMEATVTALGKWVPNAAASSDVVQEQTLRWQIALAGLECLIAVTSVVNSNSHAASDVRSADHGSASGATSHDDDDDDVVRFSTSGIEDDVAPASVSALASLSAGAVSRFAVSVLSSTPPEVLAPAHVGGGDSDNSRDESLALGCVQLLVNLAEADPYVHSANCVAALLPLLEGSTATDRARLSAVVVDKVITVLWNVLNHAEGARTMSTLDVAPIVKRLSADPAAAESTRLAAQRLSLKLDALVENPRFARDKR